MKYRVVWEIDIDDANDPVEAARKAREYQTGDTAATVFTVIDEQGKKTEVDLEYT